MGSSAAMSVPTTRSQVLDQLHSQGARSSTIPQGVADLYGVSAKPNQGTGAAQMLQAATSAQAYGGLGTLLGQATYKTLLGQ